MKSLTHPSPARKNLQFQLNMETQEVLMELNSLLRSLGAPAVQAQAAIAGWEGNILIEEGPDTKLPLHYLPVSLIPKFIDRILDQLTAGNRAKAIQMRDGSRTMEAVVRLATTLKLSNKPEEGGIDPSHVLHDIFALKPSQGITSAKATQGTL